jgi:anaerobic ribonucleoside-triphosphate reductase activating protein
MYYANILKDSMVNGDGLRIVLFVSGCEHHCKGCHNQITWNPNFGTLFTEETKNEIFKELDKDYISGITFSGGDPLFSTNLETVTELCKEIKEKYPTKTIWLYTGYTYDDVKDFEVFKYVNYVVDGRFEIDKKVDGLEYRGSSNQKIIKIQ